MLQASAGGRAGDVIRLQHVADSPAFARPIGERCP